MKKAAHLIAFTLLFISCQKNDPIAELDQEEVGSAEILFTEVARQAHDDHYHYHEVEAPETARIKFSGVQMLPAIDAHIHLSKGKTYRFQLRAKDFYGRETEQTFVDNAESHFAFILGIPTGAAEVVYADMKSDGSSAQVGITGYITVTSETDKFTVRYIMRHLNKGVREQIEPTRDWSNSNFAMFTGANDLDIKFDLHFVDGDHRH